ncbi:MAG: hypothetical protein J7M19_02030 [Planctomycetes bacterium]|nr:hypothetical protein [Planctomycetota bacterium]
MADGLGSVRNLIDANEVTQNTYDYYAFGKELGSWTENNRPRYSSHQRLAHVAPPDLCESLFVSQAGFRGRAFLQTFHDLAAALICFKKWNARGNAVTFNAWRYGRNNIKRDV